jgi:signal transduction histidine kinase
MVLLALGAGPTSATATDYSLREWHTADGLPNEEVGWVLQARDRFLWLLTTAGPVRFDGSQFEVHRAAVPGGFARSLVDVPALGLVVAPTAGGLQVWRAERFQPLALPAAVSGRIFSTLFVATDGALWAGGDDGTVLRWREGAVETFATSDQLHGRPVFTLASDEAGATWVANGTTLARHDGGRLVPVPLDLGGSELRVGSSRRGGPWLATQDGLYKMNGDRPERRLPLPALLSAHYISMLFEDRAGTLWIGTRSQGVHRLSGEQLVHVPTAHEDIIALCEDGEGDLWVATNGGGLSRLRPSVVRLFDKAAGLRDNFSDTVCEDVAGIVWFGNRDGGVARLRDGVIDFVPPPPEWPVISAVSVAPHPDGAVWATAGPGLFRISEQPALAMRQLALPTLPIIRCSYATRRGELWFSADPDRLGRITGERVELFGRESGFDGRQTRYITEDAEGRVWAATADGKVFRQVGARFERVPLDVPTGVINAVHVDAAGLVWLATAERGLVVRVGGTWRVIDAGRGLPDNNLTQLLDDGRGYFWFGSTRGIFRVRQAELAACLEQPNARVHAVSIGKDEGLKDIACLGYFQPAAWKTRDGKLWFTTRRGVLRLDPALAIPEAPSPLVQVRELTVDERAIAPAAGLELPPGLRKLEFRFAVLCLGTPERVRVRYQLEGFDADWNVAGPRRSATYPRLSPGRYRFRVEADLGDGSESPRVDELEFTVETPWWQSAWLQLGGALFAAAGIAWAGRAWSHRRLRLRLERLEREGAIERERTRIAQNIHDDLGASLTRISLLTQSAAGDGTTGGLLERIYATAVEATRAMDEIVWAVNPKYDDLDSLASYLGNFAQDFLGAAGIRCRLDVPGDLPAAPLTSQIRHHLFLSCKEALHNVVKHAAATEVTITVRAADHRLTLSVTDNGRGLPATGEPARDGARVLSGHGVANMANRLAAMQGTCEIRPGADGRGVTVAFSLPYFFVP